MKPQSAKNKGRIFQQYIRDLILDVFKNVLKKDDVRSTSMGAGGEDILLSPLARSVFPYQVECKSKRDSAAHTMYNQAKEHGDHEPVVFIKKNNDIALAIIRAEHFLELIRKINENQPSN